MRGSAIIFLAWPGETQEKHRDYYAGAYHYHKMWTGWHRLLKLTRELRNTSYTIKYEFADDKAIARLTWAQG